MFEENSMLDKDFKKIIDNIKQEIQKTQYKVAIESNINLISMYFRLGKILNDNYEYGNKFIDEVSKDLKMEFPNSTGFSVRNLKYMKKFYLEYKDDEEVQQLVAQVPWGHNIILMEKVKDKEVRKVYIEGILKNGWGRNMLSIQIDNGYHLRIGASNNNFENTLPALDSDLVNYTIKDPYIFDFLSLQNEYKEKELENAMINKIRDVLIELGKGFSFVGNQYKINVGEQEYFIDLLFYHLELRRYVVVELKANSFKPEYAGQIGFYVTAVDETLKKEQDNPTIGLLLCKDKDKLTVDYSLKSINVPIGVSSFEIEKYIPKDILEKLPTEEDINKHIDINTEEE
jgi:predicted nuclease of restriction endonuclease-like (RecB) superfamily